MKACMQHLPSSGMVHHGGRRVAECGEDDWWGDGVIGVHGPKWWSFNLLSNGDCAFLCSGISSKEVTNNLAAASARSLPRIFVCSLILFSAVERPRIAL